MPSLAQGLYELLVTQLLEEQLRHPQLQGTPDVDELRNAEAADRIALHVAKVVETAIEDGPAEDRSVEGVKLARRSSSSSRNMLVPISSPRCNWRIQPPCCAVSDDNSLTAARRTFRSR